MQTRQGPLKCASHYALLTGLITRHIVYTRIHESKPALPAGGAHARISAGRRARWSVGRHATRELIAVLAGLKWDVH